MPKLPAFLNKPGKPGASNGSKANGDLRARDRALEGAKEGGIDLVGWVDERTGATSLATGMLYRHVPKGTNWFYTLGSATMFAFIAQAITGVFRSDLDAEEEPPAVKREDGSWLLAGYMQADEMADLLGIDLPENRDYETVAGYILSHLHHLPATGECVDAQGWRFEVVDLDGRRIDKVIASRLPGVHRAKK